MMWGWLKPSIDRGVKQGVERAIKEYDWGGAIRKVLAGPEYRWFWFVKAMQGRMMDVDPSMDGKLAFDVAMRAYRDFLKEEKIEFGHPDYDWSAAGARDLIEAMEIDHWESR